MTLAVAIPFYRDDPTALIEALGRDARAAQVALVVVDDGTGDLDLTLRVQAALAAYPGDGRLITLPANKGRSIARNTLIKATLARHVLFLDSDMMPDVPDFLSRWLDMIAADNPAVAFGGFTARQVPRTRSNALAHYLAATSDCPPAPVRAERGALAVATSNLLVRRDVLDSVPFDAGFTGWGWEDVDWALRASARFSVQHVDIPATHLGLDDACALLRKYANAGPNLQRLLRNHPSAASLPGVKVARMVSRWPHRVPRPLLAFLAIDPAGMVPLPLRALAAKLWRASFAAEALA